MAFTPHGVVFCVTSLTLACAACLPATRREFLDRGYGVGGFCVCVCVSNPRRSADRMFFFCAVKKDVRH